MIRRSRHSSQSGQILIIVLVSLLGGSGLIGVGIFATGKSIEDIEDTIEDVVLDEGRREAAEQILKQWTKEGERFLESNAERVEDLLEKLERHDAKAEELSAAFSAMQAANLKIQGTVLDRRFALREQLTREEWQKVFPR